MDSTFDRWALLKELANDPWGQFTSTVADEYYLEPMNAYKSLTGHGGDKWDWGGKSRARQKDYLKQAEALGDVGDDAKKAALKARKLRMADIAGSKATGEVLQGVGKVANLGFAAMDVAQPFLRMAGGQEWDDAIVGTAGDMAGSAAGMKIGAATGAALGSFVPVIGTGIGAAVGGLGGAIIGGAFGGDAANWAWGKITGDDTWGGYREDPKAAKQPQPSNEWDWGKAQMPPRSVFKEPYQEYMEGMWNFM